MKDADPAIAPLPLVGVRILDLTRVLAGPICTMILADLGAEVIKIESPGRGDDTRAWGPPFVGGESAYFLSVNRNKESITIDLQTDRGRRLLHALASKSDAIVSNFRESAGVRLGVAEHQVREHAPRIVYCAISGIAPSGRYAEVPMYDPVVEAMGGLMSITGHRDSPPTKVGVALVDVLAGVYSAVGILAALRRRDHTGLGLRIDISLLDVLLASLVNAASSYLATGESPQHQGSAHANIAPFQTFMASDRHVMVAAGNDRQWRSLCTVIGRRDLAHDRRFATNSDRVANGQELSSILAAEFREQPAGWWAERLTAAGVSAAPVNTIAEAFESDAVRSRDMIATVDHRSAGPTKIVRSPLLLEGQRPNVRSAPPLLGQDSIATLRRVLGLDDTAIGLLLRDGVVTAPAD